MRRRYLLDSTESAIFRWLLILCFIFSYSAVEIGETALASTDDNNDANVAIGELGAPLETTRHEKTRSKKVTSKLESNCCIQLIFFLTGSNLDGMVPNPVAILQKLLHSTTFILRGLSLKELCVSR